jgi:hypothetical protein
MIGRMKGIKTVLAATVLLAGSVLILFYLYVWLIDYKTRIHLTGGEKPTFNLSGSGRLVDFVLMGPRQRPGSERNSFVVWELKPIGDPFEAETVGMIGAIEYGAVPRGFEQIFPERSMPPPPLRSGEKYLLQAYTNNAPWGQIAFEIRAGKAIEIPIK